MKLIKSSEISGRILTLMEESNERVILISPYMKIAKWYKLVKKLDELKSRGVLLEIYVRDDPNNQATYQDLDQLALPYKKIAHLHSKLYLNEHQGIVTSMNLLLSSEINSLEIGLATETWSEYDELSAYYHRHFQKGKPIQLDSVTGPQNSDLDQFVKSIKEALLLSSRNSWFWLEGITLNISTGGNNYRLSIIDGNLNITTGLRPVSKSKQGKLPPLSSIAGKVSDLTNMKVRMQTSPGSNRVLLTGQSCDKLQSASISRILESESVSIRDAAVRFIKATDDPLLWQVPYIKQQTS